MKETKQTVSASKKSAFAALGLKATVEQLKEEVRELYLADDVPWIIGYSGGKDSTAVLQLTWLAIAGLLCTIVGFLVMFFTQNQGYGGLFAR